jgi:hypothetical protein
VEALTAGSLLTAVTSVLVAVFGFAGVALAAILLRRTGKGTLNVSAAQVNLTDRQFQARWEERLENFTKMQGDNYAHLLERAGEANERLLAEVTHQGAELDKLRQTIAGLQEVVAEIPTLRRLLAECEARDALRDVAEAERDAQIGRMAREIRRLGGDPAC